MATANGGLTPPSPEPSSPSSASKRKRSQSTSLVQLNGTSTQQSDKASEDKKQAPGQFFEDILDVLKGYDTKPSILEYPISSSRARPSSLQPSKRPKVADLNSTTISQQVQSGAYTDLDQLLQDVDAASADLLSSQKKDDIPSHGQVSLTLEQTRLVTGILALKKVLRSMSLRKGGYEKSNVVKDMGDVKPVLTNGTAEKGLETMVDDIPDRRTVLTIYGSAQRNQQLFSSLQKLVGVGKQDSPLDTSVKVLPPLNESSLPNVISTTRIVPGQIELVSREKPKPTFKDSFGPPASIRPLHPPKPAKRSTAKTIGWSSGIVPAPRSKNTTYTNQSLSTGMWLGYGGLDLHKDPSSPIAKQRYRQRALSTGEAHPPLSESEALSLELAKEEALFRSVYSSFAPCRDDSVAIVPEALKNQVWWQKIGARRFHETFAIDPALLGDEVQEESAVTEGDSGPMDTAEDEEEVFRQAVEAFEPQEIDPALDPDSKEEKEVDAMLREVSELLETLSSFQRIRNSTLSTASRPPIAQTTSASPLIGTPSAPSTAEVELYKTLKAQLSLLVSQLPPYAVAKLNGDQLEELNISQKIVIEKNDYRGIMEEDQLTRLAKQMAYPAAATPAPRLAPTNQSHYAATANQYTRTPTAHVPPRPGPSYYPQQQPPQRSPSVHYQRPVVAAGTPGPGYQGAPGGYPVQTPRQSFSATQAYGQQTPRPAYQNNSSYYQQHQQPQQRMPQPGYPMGSQYFTPTQQSQSQMRYQQPAPTAPQYAQQHRPPGVNPMYNYPQTPHMRTASPLKAAPATGQPQYAQQPRPMYGSTGTPQARPGTYFASLPAQGTPHPPLQQQYGSGPGTPAHHHMNPGAPYAPPGTPGLPHHQPPRVGSIGQMPHPVNPAALNRQGSGTPQPPQGQGQGQGQQQQQVNGAQMVA